MDKSDNAAFEVSVYFIEEGCLFALIADRLGRVRDAPMKHGSFSRLVRRWSGGPNGAGLLGVIADSYNDIEILAEELV